MTRFVTVVMHNGDPFSNKVKAWDANHNNNKIWDGIVPEHTDQPIQVLENDSGYCNVVTSTDGNPSVSHSLLKAGDSFDI